MKAIPIGRGRQPHSTPKLLPGRHGYLKFRLGVGLLSLFNLHRKYSSRRYNVQRRCVGRRRERTRVPRTAILGFAHSESSHARIPITVLPSSWPRPLRNRNSKVIDRTRTPLTTLHTFCTRPHSSQRAQAAKKPVASTKIPEALGGPNLIYSSELADRGECNILGWEGNKYLDFSAAS